MTQVIFRSGKSEVSSICPICGTRGAIPYLQVNGVARGTAQLEMSECEGCATLYFTSDNPVVGYDHLGFEEDYWLHYVQSGAGITAMLDPLLAVTPKKGGKLLDVGCGFGFIPHFWESCGYGQAIGLEKSFYGRIGQEKLGTTVYHAYYNEADQIAGEKFDYVYSSEVLEHVPDPVAFIDEISGALASDGILILTTPCADAVKPDTPYQDVIAILSPGFHYFVTREDALRHLLQKQGFEHIHIYNSGSRLFAWASHQPLPHIEPGFRHWEEYYGYLEILSRNTDPHVAGGALYRFVKDTVNRNRLDLTTDALDRWVILARATYDLDLLSPPEIERRFMATTDLQNERFPSWLGCGLLFYARSVMRMGGDSRLLLATVRSAIAIMEREVEQFAQFAQEPAYFLPLARGTLRELSETHRASVASDIPPYFVRAPKISANGRAVGLLCGYAPDGQPSPALVTLCQAMARNGVDVHICLAVDSSVRSIDTSELESATTIAFRQNDSYDFGVWSAQLAALPGVWDAERVIFLNDSILLINDKAFSAMMDELRSDETEFIALTESHSPSYHTQSYFFQLRGPALHDWRLRSFWAGIGSNQPKSAIIHNCELRLVGIVRQNRTLRTRTLFGYQKLFPHIRKEEAPEGNPTHSLWERLLMNGMPFIKGELVHRNPMRLPLGALRIVLRGVGADMDMVDRHLRELDRNSRKREKDKPIDIALKRMLGKKRFQRIREWNRKRLSRRRAKRGAR